jgi:hypothetical protein|tara:strand:- start:345 stop:581 length:237 start_codon:yes stop_codon:yes gene_type:complete
MKSKYEIGQVVKVFEYYAEGDIVKDVYHGLIVDIDKHRFPRKDSVHNHYIYHVLPNSVADHRTTGIQLAEEFAIEEIT